MTSVERTAYPRLDRSGVSVGLERFSLDEANVEWARDQTRTDANLLSLVLGLSCFEQLGYFLDVEDIPEAVVHHVRCQLGLPEGTDHSCESERTAEWHRHLVREHLSVVYDPARVRSIVDSSIRSAALVKNNPPDLINVAIEMLVAAQ